MTVFQDKRWIWISVVMYTSILGIVCKDEWSKVETVITGCSTVLKWHIHNDFNDTITITRNNVKLTSFLLKDENISISKPMDVKKEVGESETVLLFIINNATLEDTGHYICTLDKLYLYKHTQLNVIDFQWNNDDEPVKVRPGDDVTIKWEYILLSRRLKKDIFLYTEDKKGNVTMLAFWFNGMFKSETTRMTFNLTTAENSFVEKIYLTLHNATTKDYNLTYYLKLDCHRNCSKLHLPITLIEDVGYKWLPVNPTSVETSISQDVELVWNYQTEKSPNKIIITRKNTTNNKVENIGMWTPERGFKIETNLTAIFEISQRFEMVNHSTTTGEITNSSPNPTLTPGTNTKPGSMDATTGKNKSTPDESGDHSSPVKSSQFEVSIVTVNISQGRITLRLLNVNTSDVDIVYYCHVHCGDWFTSKQGLTLTEVEQQGTSPATSKPSLSRMTGHEIIVLSASLATTVIVLVLIFILLGLATRKLSHHYNKEKERPKSAVSTNSNSPASSRYPYKPMSGLTSYIARPDVEPTKRNSGGLREFLSGD